MIDIGLAQNTKLTVKEVLQELNSDHRPVVFELDARNIKFANKKPQNHYEKADDVQKRGHQKSR